MPKKKENRGGSRTGAGRPDVYTCKVVTKLISIPILAVPEIEAKIKEVREKYRKNLYNSKKI